MPFVLYHQWVPAFAALYLQADRQWPAFHREVAALAGLGSAERTRRLEELAPRP